MNHKTAAVLTVTGVTGALLAVATSVAISPTPRPSMVSMTCRTREVSAPATTADQLHITRAHPTP